MSCIETEDTASFRQADWADGLFRAAYENRIPLSGMLELTSRCNLRCIHCYLGDQTAQHAKRAAEMDTPQVKSLLDELSAAGTLFLTITGGDPMMRKDFPEIYRHAIELGMLVIVFCDGVLVTESIVNTFRDLPPRRVEISVYGASQETYEKITQVPGSFEKCLRGIERLLDAGITVGLKTVLMTENQHEFDQIRELAAAYSVPFRFDPAIFPCLPDSSKDPLKLRVDAKTAIDKELATGTAKDSWRRAYAEGKDLKPDNRVFKCGAGARSFYVGPFGEVSPCVMTSQHRFQRGTRSFVDVWRSEIAELRERRIPGEAKDHECSSCEKRSLCTGCAAFNFLETGEETKKSEYVCELTQERWARVIDDPSPAPSGRSRLPIIK